MKFFPDCVEEIARVGERYGAFTAMAGGLIEFPAIAAFIAAGFLQKKLSRLSDSELLLGTRAIDSGPQNLGSNVYSCQ